MYLGSEISGEVIETGEGVKQLSKVSTYIYTIILVHFQSSKANTHLIYIEVLRKM